MTVRSGHDIQARSSTQSRSGQRRARPGQRPRLRLAGIAGRFGGGSGGGGGSAIPVGGGIGTIVLIVIILVVLYFANGGLGSTATQSGVDNGTGGRRRHTQRGVPDRRGRQCPARLPDRRLRQQHPGSIGHEELPQHGVTYTEAITTLYDGGVNTGCGQAARKSGPSIARPTRTSISTLASSTRC